MRRRRHGDLTTQAAQESGPEGRERMRRGIRVGITMRDERGY